MDTQDNRIRFPTTRVDFDADVGVTGQDHDEYPAPSSQARFDHMRLYLIGLLAQQSSLTAPTECREGTPWFDLNTFSLKIRKNGAWVSYANAIALTEPDTEGDVITLAEWYTTVEALLAGSSPEVVFMGQCTENDVTSITIPSSVQSLIVADSKVFMTIAGSLVDPRNCSLIGSPPTTIHLSNIALSSGDTFIVNIRRIVPEAFVNSTVVVP